MSGMYAVKMGDRGRLVIPAELRQRAGMHEGAAITLIETPRGVVLMRREQLRDAVRDELEGVDLVDELISERRRASADEDAS